MSLRGSDLAVWEGSPNSQQANPVPQDISELKSAETNQEQTAKTNQEQTAETNQKQEFTHAQIIEILKERQGLEMLFYAKKTGQSLENVIKIFNSRDEKPLVNNEANLIEHPLTKSPALTQENLALTVEDAIQKSNLKPFTANLTKLFKHLPDGLKFNLRDDKFELLNLNLADNVTTKFYTGLSDFQKSISEFNAEDFAKKNYALDEHIIYRNYNFVSGFDAFTAKTLNLLENFYESSDVKNTYNEFMNSIKKINRVENLNPDLSNIVNILTNNAKFNIDQVFTHTESNQLISSSEYPEIDFYDPTSDSSTKYYYTNDTANSLNVYIHSLVADGAVCSNDNKFSYTYTLNHFLPGVSEQISCGINFYNDSVANFVNPSLNQEFTGNDSIISY